MSCRVTISVAQIMRHCNVNNEWLTTKEQRANWVERFEEEIAGIRRNMIKEQERIDAGKEDWHREWAEGQVAYLRKEIKKRERYIRQIKALESDV